MTLPNNLTADQRTEYLEAISRAMGSGDAAQLDKRRFWSYFYTVPSHREAFDPRKMLILGERGCGKTHLFRALTAFGAANRIERTRSGWDEHTTFLYQSLSIREHASRFAEYRSLRNVFGAGSKATDMDAADFWRAYLVRHLEGEFFPAERQTLRPLFDANIELADQVLAGSRSCDEAIITCMRDLDTRLAVESKVLIFAYDELDFLGEFDFATMERAVRGLLIFWGQYRQRWPRIQPKIFMRSDLFRYLSQNPTAETSKIIANRLELQWSDCHLYQMLVKRLLNCHEAMRDYATAAKIAFAETETGLSAPATDKLDRHRAFVELLCGKYMGANFRKGHTWTWILNHLRDGRGKVPPRALLLLIQNACAEELREPQAVRRQLLHYTSIRRALDKVAAHEVSQATELPWISRIKPRLEGLGTPIAKEELLNKLRNNWSKLWDEAVPKPDDRVDAFLSRLIEWGIVHERSDGRLDVPDLYRAGLEMWRKGGVDIGRRKK